jgi:hypothetical protein
MPACHAKKMDKKLPDAIKMRGRKTSPHDNTNDFQLKKHISGNEPETRMASALHREEGESARYLSLLARKALLLLCNKNLSRRKPLIVTSLTR